MSNAHLKPPVYGLQGVARPAPAIRAAMKILHGGEVKSVPLAQAMDESTAILGLEGLLKRAKEAHPEDLRCQAAFILCEMRKAGK